MYVVNRTTILSSLVVNLLLFACLARTTLGQYDPLLAINQDTPQQSPQVPQATASNGLQQAATSSRQPQQEIFVQPNSPVRLECRIPQLDANRSSTTYYWNFQRSSHLDARPDLLCFKGACPDESTYGIQLEVDPSSGAYDLLIANATYELNDGIYYCDYKDTTAESRVTINRVFRLTVLIPPQPPSIATSSLAPPREGQEYQLNCASFGGNPEPNITWFRNEQQLSSAAGVRIEQARQNGSTTGTLTWIPTIDDHQATYKCSVSNKAMNGMAAYERELTLTVEYAPRITVGPFNPLRVVQGERATISCEVNANPPAKGIRWLLDGHPISNHFNHTIHDVKISDAGQYSCQADNGILPPAALLLSSSGIANSGSSSGSTSSLFASIFGLGSSSAQSSDSAGLKTAVETRLQLEVLYPPRVRIIQSRPMPLAEGDFLTLNCSVESWPPAHEFIWTKQDYDSVQRLPSSGPTIELHSVTANSMGNYTCTAVNRMEPSGSTSTFDRQSSASSLVLVRHKPGLAELIAGQNGVTELGNQTLIQCRARPPGYPEPQYRFMRHPSNGGGKPSVLNPIKGPVYTIFSAQQDSEAKYSCVASNELGVSNEAEGELIVYEAPRILDDKRRSEDTRPPGDSPYSITVRATGKPEPKVTWFHRSPIDGRRVALNSAEMMSKFRIESNALVSQPSARSARYEVVSTLVFKSPLEVDDRGLYSVEFNNGLSRSAVENFQLHIYHPPVPMARQQPAVVSRNPRDSMLETHLKAAFDLGEVAHLTCRVSAYPKPEVVWYAEKGEELHMNSRYKLEQNNTVDDIWESTISFTMARNEDYGQYLCVTANSDPMTGKIADNVRIFTNLSRKSLPDPPSQPEQIDATQDSVSLQWVAGFDGGYAQNQFVVQYALEDLEGGMSLAARAPSASQDQLMQDLNAIQQLDPMSPQLFNCHSMNPCKIPNLLPKHTYLMRVKAQNERGDSRFSEEIRVHTRANDSHMPRILDARFDSASGVLYFHIEPSPEYLLNNVNARIEYKSLVPASGLAAASKIAGDQPQDNGLVLDSEWRPYTSVSVRQERAEVNLGNLQQQQLAKIEQFRLVLCSRLNDQLCGQEYVVGAHDATSSFLQDQRGLSLSIVALMSIVVLIALVGSFATSVHSCCLSRKAKKAAALDRADGRHHLTSNGSHANGASQLDNKSSLGHTNGGLINGNGSHKGSHGSTITTSNDSSTNNLTNNNGQSMDLIHGHLGANLNVGSASDHSSDHSRQAKLDSMLPPNYNHYADRASLMLEQQQQAAYLQNKLSSPFGLPAANVGTNASLMNSLSNNSQNGFAGGHSPTSLMANQFAYNQHQLSSLEQQQQQNSMMFGDHLHHDQTANGISLNSMLSDPSGANNSQSIVDGHSWPAHQFTDDYNNYNTLASYHSQMQPQPPAAALDQLPDPTYGTAASLAAAQAAANASGLMIGQQSAAYDNNANSQFSQYVSAYNSNQQHDSSQYQQEIAAAQQQMYGTLTRNSGYNHDQEQQQSILDHQQQQPDQLNDPQQQQYMSTNGLIQPPPPAAESDYGTTRGGRLIREIIV